MMRLMSSIYFVGVLIVIQLSVMLLFWKGFLPIEKQYQQHFQAPANNPSNFLAKKAPANQLHLMPRILKQKNYRIFKNLDYEDLFFKIKSATRRNLRVRIVAMKKSKNATISLKYTPLSFPKHIDVAQNKPGKNPTTQTKKYVFVQAPYGDQLSKNTRAFLSLCAQAALGGRRVVTPFVQKTRFSSNSRWSPLDTYYDTKYLNRLLEAAGYASLVDEKEYAAECPSTSPEHVSVHFIDNSTPSKDYTKKHCTLNDDFYSAILKNTTKKGWSQCSFLHEKMNRKFGEYYCVNGDVIKDWEMLEKDVIKNKKCFNIYLWRGIDGVTYRHKFSEEKFEFSSVDLTYSLKFGKIVADEAEGFTKKALSTTYIALYIRGEIMFLSNSIDYLRNCVDLALEVLMVLKNTTNISKVYIATDMSNVGSRGLANQNGGKTPFKDIHAHVISKSQGIAYEPSSDDLDRGVIALVDITLVSQAQHLISAGTGTFQKWVVAKFLQNHRNDTKQWSKISICN